MFVAVVQECMLMDSVVLSVDANESPNSTSALNPAHCQHSWMKIMMSCPKHPDGQ